MWIKLNLWACTLRWAQQTCSPGMSRWLCAEARCSGLSRSGRRGRAGAGRGPHTLPRYRRAWADNRCPLCILPQLLPGLEGESKDDLCIHLWIFVQVNDVFVKRAHFIQAKKYNKVLITLGQNENVITRVKTFNLADVKPFFMIAKLLKL